MADYSSLDAAVAKFRAKSPNIAKAFDELKKHSIRQDDELTRIGGSMAKPPAVVPPSGDRMWAASSPLNTPIGSSPTVLLNYGQGQLAQISSTSFNVNTGGFGVGFFDADGSWPVIPVMPQFPSDGWVLDNVPFQPSIIEPYVNAMNALSDPEHHCVVRHTAGGKAYNLYALSKSGTTWRFNSPGVLRLSGSGIWNNNHPVAPTGPWLGHASGFCSVSGAVLLAEVLAGQIDHAIGLLAPKDFNRTDYVSPASSSDGTGGGGALPMGTRIQLDPTKTDADFASWGISAAWRCVPRALQIYGGFTCDSTDPGGTRFSCRGQSWGNSGNLASQYPAFDHAAMGRMNPHFRAIGPAPSVVFDDKSVFNNPHK